MSVQSIVILGSTGSIGVSTLDVLARHPDRFRVYALTAHTSVETLLAQCRQFQPRVAVVGNAAAAQQLQDGLRALSLNTEVLYGPEALCLVASAAECDVVMAAIVGAAGLASTLAAARAGKKILLANKEALVMAGPLLMDAVAVNGACLLPIDSEHNAIFQCMPRDFERAPDRHGIARITLTASGGPFLHRAVDTLDRVTPEEAVAHPKWVMGRKISVDSATMMNKGLEIIEAAYLFGMTNERVDVLIHHQQIIHSLVEYSDGSTLAQLGAPDMRTPIACAFAWPDRLPWPAPRLDLAAIGQLTFEEPDLRRFPALKIAKEALAAGGAAPAVMNAANEVAVAAFLDRKIGFLDIAVTVAETLERVEALGLPVASEGDTLERARQTDSNARRVAHDVVSGLAR